MVINIKQRGRITMIMLLFENTFMFESEDAFVGLMDDAFMGE